MQTPEFDKLAIKDQVVKKSTRLTLIAAVSASLAFVGGGALMATDKTSWWAFVLAGCIIAIGMAESDVRGSVYKDQNKARQVFIHQIINKHLTSVNVESFETAKLMAEYVLGFMTNDEKNKILSVYKSTDFNDANSVSAFAQKINKIVDDVLNRRSDLAETLADIAAGQTYMFNGYNYDKRGHGSR